MCENTCRLPGFRVRPVTAVARRTLSEWKKKKEIKNLLLKTIVSRDGVGRRRELVEVNVTAGDGKTRKLIGDGGEGRSGRARASPNETLSATERRTPGGCAGRDGRDPGVLYYNRMMSARVPARPVNNPNTTRILRRPRCSSNNIIHASFLLYYTLLSGGAHFIIRIYFIWYAFGTTRKLREFRRYCTRPPDSSSVYRHSAVLRERRVTDPPPSARRRRPADNNVEIKIPPGVRRGVAKNIIFFFFFSKSSQNQTRDDRRFIFILISKIGFL